MPSHPFCVWNFQFGVGWSLDSNDCLVLETADGADVVIGDIAQRGDWGQGSEQHRRLGSFTHNCPKKSAKGPSRQRCL